MAEISEENKMHHYLAIEMNIQTWKLLGKENRDERDNTRMVNLAMASLYHWKKSYKFKPVNEQRGQWMLSHVYAVLGKGEKALSHAEKTAQLTEELDLQDFDLAYSYEAMERAYASLGNREDCLHWLNKAKETSTCIANEKDQNIFVSDLKSEPWYNCT